MKYPIKKIIGAILLTAILLYQNSASAYARILFETEFLLENSGSAWIIDSADDVTGDLTLQFGNSLGETITWDSGNAKFNISDDIQIQGGIEATGAFNLDGNQIIDDDDNEAFLIRKDGDAGDVFTVNTNSPGATVNGRFTIDGSADVVQEIIQGTAGQTNDIFQAQNSAGGVLTRIDDEGNIIIPSTNTTSNGNLITIANSTTPGGGDSLEGIKVDLTGVDLTNGPGLIGFDVNLPNPYGAGLEYAGRFTGDIFTVVLASDAEALYSTDGTTEVRLNDAGSAIQADGNVIIDQTNTEALLIRQNGDANDVFIADTTNRRIGINTAPDNPLDIENNGAVIEIGDGTASDATITFDDGTDRSFGWDDSRNAFHLSENTDIDGTILTIDADNTGAGANTDIISEQGSDNNGTLRYDASDNRWKINNNATSFSDIHLANIFYGYDNTGGQTIDGNEITLNIDTTVISDANYTLSNDEVTINETGLYRIAVEIGATDTDTTGGARCNTELTIQEDNLGGGTFVDIPGAFARCYHRETTDSNCRMSAIRQFDATDIIRARILRINGTVNYETLPGASGLFIERIR